MNMPAPPAADPDRVIDLVRANHILYAKRVLDGFGHVSVRHDRHPELFLIARSMAPATVTSADILVCGLDGEPVDPQGRRTYVERFIHSAIYAARPDVQAIVHSHSPALIPFGVTGARLRPVCHMSGFLGAAVPTFDIRSAMPEPSDLLVRSRELGEALAQTLGQAAVALMRGHGSVTVGASIQQVVFRSIYAESNAAIQAQAMRLGEVRYLSEAEAALAAATNDQHLDRPWQLWLQELQSGRRAD